MLRTSMAVAALAALLVPAAPASAQTDGGSAFDQASAPELVTSFNCKTAMRPDQTTVCSSPQLAAMDIQMSTLYTVAGKLLPASEAGDLQASQRAFLNKRATCGEEFRCIGDSYAARIAELGHLVDQAALVLERNRAERAQEGQQAQ